ncbi:hypothetical protein Bca101_056233 [Brassica carinata]
MVKTRWTKKRRTKPLKDITSPPLKEVPDVEKPESVENEKGGPQEAANLDGNGVQGEEERSEEVANEVDQNNRGGEGPSDLGRDGGSSSETESELWNIYIFEMEFRPWQPGQDVGCKYFCWYDVEDGTNWQRLALLEARDEIREKDRVIKQLKQTILQMRSDLGKNDENEDEILRKFEEFYV